MKLIFPSIVISSVLILFTIFFVGNNKDNQQNNVEIINGVQVIDLTARGGYSPRRSIAKADVPTILRINTKGTFDCSATLRIPSMDISRILPLTGATEIDLNIPKKGILYGSCGMGMYPFEIDFR